MGGFVILLLLSIVMAMASFFAGILPLSITLSPRQLRLVSIIGMGVLVGTSLIVIIPEGVETIYTSDSVMHSHARRADRIASTKMEMLANSIRTRTASISVDDIDLSSLLGSPLLDLPMPILPDSIEHPPTAPTDPDMVGILESLGSSTENNHDQKEETEAAHHAWIGVALIAGFILMFLIDKLPRIASSSSQSKGRTNRIALNHIGRRFNLTGTSTLDEEESEEFIESDKTPEPVKTGSATTIGLVIHAAADGIALGASSSTSHTNLSLIIFFAIMIHKAPAAFGLTSILMRQGLSKKSARAHLIVFSLAAPIGAIMTWIIGHIISRESSETTGHSQWWTGILLLFSAGTFLYVAMHSMQEVLNHQSSEPEIDGAVNGSLDRRNSNAEPQQEHTHQDVGLVDVGAAVLGMILPLFLQVGHAHS